MTAQEMIKKYNVRPQEKLENGEIVLTGKIYSSGMSRSEMKEFGALVPEIKRILFAEWTAKRQAEADRKAKIDAIDGLKEIRDAEDAAARWHAQFSRWDFDGVVKGECPPDVDALKERYPRAAAYLKADEMAGKVNGELSKIGRKAVERIINEPDSYEDALAEMDAATKAFADKHMWD